MNGMVRRRLMVAFEHTAGAERFQKGWLCHIRMNRAFLMHFTFTASDDATGITVDGGVHVHLFEESKIFSHTVKLRQSRVRFWALLAAPEARDVNNLLTTFNFN
jgi:hypothetical protein